MVTNAVEARQGMYPLRAVDRVCDIIDLLAEHPGGITLSTLAVAVGLPKSSAFRYLAALEARGYVVRSDDGVGYRLGSPVAGGTADRHGPAGAAGCRRQAVDGAADQQRHARVSMLATLDGTGIRYLWVASTLTGRIRGCRSPVIAGCCTPPRSARRSPSQLSDDAVLGLVNAAGMPQPTPSTLGSPTGLLRELHRIRGEGFAMSENERHSDVRGVAVPIGGETIALGRRRPGRSAAPQDRVGGAVRQLRRAAVVLARELRG